MKLVVTAVVRNVDHQLMPWLDTVQQVLRHEDRALLLVTDDASTDDTVARLTDFGAKLRRNERPQFAINEHRAYEEHYAWLGEHVDAGSWVLYLHPEESLSAPRKIGELARVAMATGRSAVDLPVQYLWEEGKVRIDGYWSGTTAARLFRWSPGPEFVARPIDVPPVPTYALSASSMWQDSCRLIDQRLLGINKRKAAYERAQSLLDPAMSADMIESILDRKPVLEVYEQVVVRKKAHPAVV